MGKRNKRYEEEERVVDCMVCDGVIPLEFYVSRGDMLCCDECGSEYIVKSRNPVRLFLLEEDFEEDFDEDFDEDDDYSDSFDDNLLAGRGYD